MICYDLWGTGTFANETYLCGIYKHYSSACCAMKRCRSDFIKSQDEESCDIFWNYNKY